MPCLALIRTAGVPRRAGMGTSAATPNTCRRKDLLPNRGQWFLYADVS